MPLRKLVMQYGGAAMEDLVALAVAILLFGLT
jgi:hypothetical protein